MHTVRDHKLRNVRNDLPWQNNNRVTKYFVFFILKNSPFLLTAFPTGSLENGKSFSVLMTPVCALCRHDVTQEFGT